MNVIQFLAHRRFGFDYLRMAAFLPYLIPTLLLVGSLEKRQPMQHSFLPMPLKMRNDLLCRVRFETLHVAAQVFRSRNEMEVIFKNNVAIQLKTGCLLKKSPGVQYDVNRLWASKQRQPLVDRCG